MPGLNFNPLSLLLDIKLPAWVSVVLLGFCVFYAAAADRHHRAEVKLQGQLAVAESKLDSYRQTSERIQKNAPRIQAAAAAERRDANSRAQVILTTPPVNPDDACLSALELARRTLHPETTQ